MVDVRLRLFIPSRAVYVPTGSDAGFGGDDRGFSFNGGTSRADVWVDVDNVPITSNLLTIKYCDFGQTTQYMKEKLVDVWGKPSWWKAVKKDPFLGIEASPDDCRKCDVTSSSLSVAAKLESGGPFGVIPAVRVTFHVDATNPLESLAPAINCDLDVVLSATGPTFTVGVVGSHDSFPAYELYVQQRLIYSFDPVRAGTSPLNLAYHGDIAVNLPAAAFA